MNEKNNPNLATKMQGKRTGATLENRAAIQKAIKLKKQHPDLSYEKIGKMVGRDKSNIARALQRYGIESEKVEQYKDFRADYLAGVQDKMLEAVSKKDMEKVSVRDLSVSYGILFDKERLQRGLSTQNTSLASMVEVVDKRQRKENE